MSNRDTLEKLRPHRKHLVLAASAVFERDPPFTTKQLPEKSQFTRLVAICAEASCAEEIKMYLRYQASRQNPPWGRGPRSDHATTALVRLAT